MPTDHDKNTQTNGQNGAKAANPHRRPTLERRAFVEGLFKELNEQLIHYAKLAHQMAELQARIMISERNLQLTRDHLQSVLSQTDEEVPVDWQKVISSIRFVGVRLGDACMDILREGKRLTTQDILNKLNHGQFRFKTGTPLREVNAALLRQPNVRREDDQWVYVRPDTESAGKKEPRRGPRRKGATRNEE